VLEPIRFPSEEELAQLRVYQPSWTIELMLQDLRQRQEERARYLAGKPFGGLSERRAETRFLEDNDPVVSIFYPDNVPGRITYREHLRGMHSIIHHSARCVANSLDPQGETGERFRPPLKVLVEVGVAHLFDAINDTSTPLASGESMPHWRGKLGTLFGRFEAHRELDVAPPYFIPCGEVWLLYAWRYKNDDGSTEWARPVGILRIAGYDEPPLVTLARAAR